MTCTLLYILNITSFYYLSHVHVIDRTFMIYKCIFIYLPNVIIYYTFNCFVCVKRNLRKYVMNKQGVTDNRFALISVSLTQMSTLL